VPLISGNLGAAIPEINGTYHNLVSAPGKMVAGVWQHVALTYERPSGQATIYLNGTNIVTQNLGSYVANTITDLYIGARATETCCYFRGVMDEVSLYSRALSAAEVFALYAASGSGKCKPVLAPSLQLGAGSGSNLNISWPATATEFRLESTTVFGTAWQPWPGSPMLIGDQLVIDIPPTNAARFFRLKKP
jgi:hypothetical protein